MALPVRRRNDTPAENASTWDPWGELNRLNRQLSSYLESWRPLSGLLDGFTPLADLEETPDAYVVEVELPGVKREDIDIEIAGRRVSVHGERKEKERIGILRRRERTVGRFACEVVLPGDVEDDDVEANLDGGVLTIRLPKPVRDRARKIEIH
jgi:HSP20 family protein